MTKSKQPGKGKAGGQSSPDALTKTTKAKQIELTEADLKRVSGGRDTLKFK